MYKINKKFENDVSIYIFIKCLLYIWGYRCVVRKHDLGDWIGGYIYVKPSEDV